MKQLNGIDSKSSDDVSWQSGMTKKEIEEEIVEKGLYSVVEEICARERFNVQIKKPFKRHSTICDNEEDEMTKKIRAIGIRKL